MPSASAATRTLDLTGLARRSLALAGEGDPVDASERITHFRRFLLLYGAVRSWLWVMFSTHDAAILLLPASMLTVATALAFRPRASVWAARIALPAVFFQVVWRFPFTANHLYLELVCVFLLAIVRSSSRGDDEALVVEGLRWTAALVLFHTGLQKVFYGSYFRGEFLAFMIGAEERFARIFQLLLSSDEVARLTSLDRKQTGAGPYRVDHALFVFASNAVWLAEMSLPPLMIAQRTRVFGALGGLALMAGIQVAALEMGFALLFVNLLLLFLPVRLARLLLPASALVFAWALGAAADWLPGNPADWNLL
jgi:hypothetical protein